MKMDMKFKSQICTTIEQSKRLLELGLKPETADMCFFRSTDEDVENPYTRLVVDDYILNSLESDDNIPAWSLHRLMEIGDFVNVGFLRIEKMYECCIQMLEGQIRGGIINKEYINK